MYNLNSICVYCGSNNGNKPAFLQAARELGKYLAQNNIRLIYGGADSGLMGEMANTSLEYGGEVIGVIPSLIAAEVKHSSLTHLIEVETMSQRKEEMMRLSDAFIALPGGYGTIEELFESITLAQLGYQHKPCALLNVDDFFTTLLAFLDHSVENGFIKPIHREMLIVENSLENMFKMFREYEQKYEGKWL